MAGLGSSAWTSREEEEEEEGEWRKSRAAFPRSSSTAPMNSTLQSFAASLCSFPADESAAARELRTFPSTRMTAAGVGKFVFKIVKKEAEGSSR